MVVAAPLIMTADVVARLHRLRDFAARRPVDMPALMEAMQDPARREAHRKAMTAQSVRIAGPWPFFITFSIETGHPVGTCRHMSMSVAREARLPSPAAIWMVAAELGFSGGLETCQAWIEELSDDLAGDAINIVQPLSVTPEAEA